ncbi:MAG: bifunctional transaldolase/phosoglucose isomerase [Anaerolineae bacterium]|nr:bifunctional transaldolase/phosoglucose isomerase [Anaerolineae bacterium]
MNEFDKIHAFGQSFWFDNIHRELIQSGQLEEMIAKGEIQGVTSNPSIFNNAIAKSTDYNDAIQTMALSGWASADIFDQLAIEDIVEAADRFLPLYIESSHWDGYVSLEVNPLLAMDTEGTIKEAKRLWERVDRPNLMIKIPATPAGLPAITQAIAAGINVNVTLIFSLERYLQVIDAYFTGLEQRLAKDLPLDNIFSVASFFVSRVDTKVDMRLHALVEKGITPSEQVAHLFGTAAIANARLAYEMYEQQFSADRFKALLSHGAFPQRPLWASTSTKNPDYPDLMYVTDLIGKDSINTLPPATLEAFRDHGVALPTLPGKTGLAREIFAEMDCVGVDLTSVFQELELEGVKVFADAYRSLIATIDEKTAGFRDALADIAVRVSARIEELDRNDVLPRLHQGDPTLWSSGNEPAVEITNRLGWLTLPEKSGSSLEAIQEFAEQVRRDGFSGVLLMGMGGSSLAPEVISEVFGSYNAIDSGIDFAILDSTDPQQVDAAATRFLPGKTLYIVSSKSGTTSEVTAFMEHFWNLAQTEIKENPGKHFIAITDPGTALEKIAQERKFRAVFHGDPEVGGRYSALSAFGIVPSALMGIDLEAFIRSAQKMADQNAAEIKAGRAPGVVLGAILAEATLAKRDKVTFIADPEISSFGSWLEQLIAESSGKQGMGIIPIDLEPLADAKDYGNDRLFIYLKAGGINADRVNELKAANHPVVTLSMKTPYDLSGEFFRWEVAIAIATHILGVNGFDQPDVQDSKTRTTAKIQEYLQTGVFIEEPPFWSSTTARVYGNELPDAKARKSLWEVIENFIASSDDGDYIAINAYLPRDKETIEILQEFRARVNTISKRATTLGFGPRFLHSTGQLHKGGPNSGMFIQISRQATDEQPPIPNVGISFATLEAAQELGDYEALRDRGRRVLRIHLLTSDLSDLLA